MATVTLHGDPIHTSGDLPPVGAVAPDFRLIDTGLAEPSLADFRGRRKVLNIVGSLDTPVCAAQARRFDAEAARLDNTVVLVISADLPFTQARIQREGKMDDVVMLSMVRTPDFAEAWGVGLTEGPLRGTCARALVVLDENDRVIHSQLVPEISEEPDYEPALAVLR